MRAAYTGVPNRSHQADVTTGPMIAAPNHATAFAGRCDRRALKKMTDACRPGDQFSCLIIEALNGSAERRT